MGWHKNPAIRYLSELISQARTNLDSIVLFLTSILSVIFLGYRFGFFQETILLSSRSLTFYNLVKLVLMIFPSVSKTFLQILPAISVFVTGLIISTRQKYVHDFRQADLKLAEYLLSLSTINANPEIECAVKKAKIWLKNSEDYRRMAVYQTIAAAHMIVATFSFFVALFFLEVQFSSSLFFALLGFTFVVLSLIGYSARFGKKGGLWSTYKRGSFFLCKLFPNLTLVHLARWREIGLAIEADERFRSYLHSLKDYKDLDELPKLGRPQDPAYFGLVINNCASSLRAKDDNL